MEQEKRVNIFIWVIIAILILFIGTFSFFNIKGSVTGQYTYEGPLGEFTFNIKKDGNLTTHILYYPYKDKLHVFPLRYGPKEFEDIPIVDNIKNKFFSKGLQGAYVTMDPDLSSKTVIAAVEIVKVLSTADYGVVKLPMSGAFIKPTNTTYPVITCADANDIHKVIWLKLGDQNKVDYKNNCVIIEGKTEDDIIKSSYRFLLILIGVMSN